VTRFEVVAAFAIGLLLPVLETVRRGLGHWAINTTTMLEDYLGGGVLLLAASCAMRRTSFAGRLLLAAWAGVAGMMTLSLISQIEVTLRAAELEPNNGAVLVIKLALWATCVTALVQSFRSVREVSA
jgi:hypothetical protein